jgi:hypothetical protein
MPTCDSPRSIPGTTRFSSGPPLRPASPKDRLNTPRRRASSSSSSRSSAVWTQGCGRQVGGTPRSWPSRCGSFSTASSTCASFSSFLSPWPPSEALLDAALADLGLGARGEGRERNR